MANGQRNRALYARRGTGQLTEFAQLQAAGRPTVPIPAIKDSRSGPQATGRPLPAPASGRAPCMVTPPPCGPGTPGTGSDPPQCPAGRVAAAILTAVRAGDLGAAAALITGLAGDPGREEVVYTMVVSAALERVASDDSTVDRENGPQRNSWAERVPPGRPPGHRGHIAGREPA